MSSDKGAQDGGNVYNMRKGVVWCACLLGVVCLALAIALPLSLTEENEIRQTTYAVNVRPHDPFRNDIFSRWGTSQKARNAYNGLSQRQIYGQLTQFDWERNQEGGVDPENYRDYLRQGLVGSLLNLQLRDETDEIQRMATEFGYVPVVFANDTIHGHSTIFPVNLAMAAAFSPELIEKGTRIAAIETRNFGVRWTFGPNLDVGRDPRWGRVSEGSGEDPYLTGVLGAAYIRGFQDEGVAACIKHVTGYGLPVGGRDYQGANVDLSEVMNIFLAAMKPAIMETWSWMPSYSALDGMAAHGYRSMINDIIRGHWGWDGVVVADYTAVEDLQNLWVAEDAKDAARKGIYAGVDMCMSDGIYLAQLDAVASDIAPDGRTYGEYAALSAKRVIALKDKLGLFDDDKLYAPAWDESVVCHDDHMAVARETVRKSIVTLVNKEVDGVPTLPLADTADTNVLLIGSLANEPRHMIGSWPARAWALPGCYPEKVATYTRAFCGDMRESSEFLCTYKNGYTHPLYPDIEGEEKMKENWKEAIAAATSGEHTHILFFVGDLEVMNGESTSRTDLNLPAVQLNMIKAIHNATREMSDETRPKLIGVYLTARATVMEWEVEHLDAIVYGWVAGHQGGHGLRDVLFGKYDSTGRLPFTVPKNVGQIPIYYYQENASREIFQWGVDCWVDDTEETPGHFDLCDRDYFGEVQYQSKYIDSKSDPRFVFAHGLHYSQYALSNIATSATEVSTKGKFTVSGTLTRTTGTMPSAEIVQLYVRDDVRTYSPPNKLLRRFQRIEFESGTGSQDFEFELDVHEDFGFYTPELEYIVEKGTFTIWVGFNSADESNAIQVEVV